MNLITTCHEHISRYSYQKKKKTLNFSNSCSRSLASGMCIPNILCLSWISLEVFLNRFVIGSLKPCLELLQASVVWNVPEWNCFSASYSSRTCKIRYLIYFAVENLIYSWDNIYPEHKNTNITLVLVSIYEKPSRCSHKNFIFWMNAYLESHALEDLIEATAAHKKSQLLLICLLFLNTQKYWDSVFTRGFCWKK